MSPGLRVAAPPRVRDRLAAAPDGPARVLHRGAHAAYLEVGGRCVGVVGTAAPQLPCALRVATPDLGELRGEAAYLRGGVLHLDGVPLRVGRLVSAAVPRLTHGVELDDRAAGELISRIGSGPGLTPEADDVLVGWLAVRHAATGGSAPADAAVRAALSRTTPLSATLLECALHGEVLPQLAAWIEAVGTPAEDACSRRLSLVGHTSGAAMLRGGRLALGSRRPRDSRRAAA